MLRSLRLRCLVASVASLPLLAAIPARAGSWTTFRGPNGNGEAQESLPPGEGPLALRLAWKRSLGSGYAGISIADGKLVTAFTDGVKDVAVALDRRTGEEIWRYELGPVFEGRDGSHDGPIATPAIDGDRVFVVDPAGRMVGLSLATGAELWSKHLVEDFGCEAPYYGFASSPAVADGTVVLQVTGEGGSVAGFDAATGELRWRTLEDGVEAQSPIVAEVRGRRQVLVMGESKLAGLDAASGELLWELEHGGESGMTTMTQSPVPLGDGRIFTKYDGGSGSAIFELGEVDGALGAWRLHESRGMARSYSPATLSGGHVYGFTSRLLSAVDPASGELLWRSREVGDGFLIAIDGQLAILQKTGSLHLGAASPEGWSETSRVDLFEDLAWTPPSYAEGSLYVRSLGEIARVDLVRGAARVAAADGGPALPEVLAPLAAVASSGDPAAAVDRFLAERSLPIVDGTSVTFLFRGEAEDVAVAGDMIGMRREEPMHRLAGTDLWWWQTELDPRARISYLFYPDLEPTVDPSHDRIVTATILGPDMNWKREESVRMSWFAMPGWPGHAAAVGAGAGEAAEESGGRIESIEIQLQPAPPEGAEEEEEEEAAAAAAAPAPEPVTATVHVWLPPGYDDGEGAYPVVYVLNPEAREEGGWLAALDRVVGSTVEPVIVVFPQMPRAPGLRGALAGQVVPAIDQRFRTRADRDSRALVGMGFRAYAATVTGFAVPDVFGALGLQSLFLTEGGMEEDLLEALGGQTAATTPMRIYFEWGRWDLVSPHEQMNFRASSRWAWDALLERGYAPVGGEVWDSTDFASWRNRTGLLLEALFPISGSTGGEPSALAAWRTGAP
jgi:outer membrane protein assembly factor BamB